MLDQKDSKLDFRYSTLDLTNHC